MQRVVGDEMEKRRTAHGRLIDFVSVTAAYLGPVHGGVGVVHQLVGLCPRKSDGDPHAGGRDHVTAP